MRTLIEAKLAMLQAGKLLDGDDIARRYDSLTLANDTEQPQYSVRDRWEIEINEIEKQREELAYSMGLAGRTLAKGRVEDPSLLNLASSSSNISIKWQQGKFIGQGTYGTVYLAVNLDSGDLMAVKELRFQDAASAPTLINQIREEMQVMAMLHHPNIVEYIGIEVHRDKVYIFEEYCQMGSLASLLEHGRIEDEAVLQLYTYQLVSAHLLRF